MNTPNNSDLTLSLDKIEEENNDPTVIGEENFEAIFDKIQNLSQCIRLNSSSKNYKMCLNLNNGMELHLAKEDIFHRQNGWFKEKEKKTIQTVSLCFGGNQDRRKIKISSVKSLNKIFKVWPGQEKALGLL